MQKLFAKALPVEENPPGQPRNQTQGASTILVLPINSCRESAYSMQSPVCMRQLTCLKSIVVEQSRRALTTCRK
jgi:hypothetical protein